MSFVDLLRQEMRRKAIPVLESILRSVKVRMSSQVSRDPREFRKAGTLTAISESLRPDESAARELARSLNEEEKSEAVEAKALCKPGEE